MSKFKVNYCKLPIRDNTDKCLIVQCDDRAEALITAYDHLTNKGLVVGKAGSLELSMDERKKLNDRKVRFQIGAGHIFTLVAPYEVKPLGKVLES
jgi:hypothetical protein